MKLTFSEALQQLKAGNKVARSGWNGKGIFIELQVPDANSKMTSPYIFIDTTGLQTDNPDAPKSRVPWLASQTDLLAEDWLLVESVNTAKHTNKTNRGLIMDTTSPYDIIVQQQIDIIASRQKDILEGKEGVSDNDLHSAITQLQNIKCCTPSQSPFGSNIFGRSSTIGAYGNLKDQLKGLGEI